MKNIAICSFGLLFLSGIMVSCSGGTSTSPSEPAAAGEKKSASGCTTYVEKQEKLHTEFLALVEKVKSGGDADRVAEDSLKKEVNAVTMEASTDANITVDCATRFRQINWQDAYLEMSKARLSVK